MPIAVVGAIVASVVALAVFWVSPAVGLVLAGAVIVAGLVLLATGRPAVGVVVALTPFAVFVLASQVVGSLWFKPYRVPSASMEPTIEIGDRVLADRHDHAPHVGDVVIAHPPVGAVENRCGAPRPETRERRARAPCPTCRTVVFIKRVVAGPGDTIAFRDGLVVRNGRPVSEPYARRLQRRHLRDAPGDHRARRGLVPRRRLPRRVRRQPLLGAGPDEGDHGRRQVPLLAAEERGTALSKTCARAGWGR